MSTLGDMLFPSDLFYLQTGHVLIITFEAMLPRITFEESIPNLDSFYRENIKSQSHRACLIIKKKTGEHVHILRFTTI